MKILIVMLIQADKVIITHHMEDFMRDLLKEFEGDVKVVREWYNDDSGTPEEKFIITVNDKDFKNYKSMKRAMERAVAMSARRRNKRR